MNNEKQIADFIKFLESNFKQTQLRIVKLNDKFITVDIDCLFDKDKILTLFITPDDIALARNSKSSNQDDSFSPFDKHIKDFADAKKQIIEIQKKGSIDM